MERRFGTFLRAAVSVFLVLECVPASSGARDWAATSRIFGYTGAQQTFVVPPAVNFLDVVAIGANGGLGGGEHVAGGVGVAVRATIWFAPVRRCTWK